MERQNNIKCIEKIIGKCPNVSCGKQVEFVYIGIQKGINEKESKLYNCPECYGTFSYENIK